MPDIGPFPSADVALTSSPDGLHDVTVLSPALGRRGDVTVFTADTRAGSGPLPLLVLLHGVHGSHWSWARSGRAHEVLAGMVATGLVPPMVLAMPSDGLFGIGSGYLGRDGEDAERWVVEEVPRAAALVEPRIDPDAISIAGLSMGGWGALRLAARHPGRYRAAVGMSPLTRLSQVAGYAPDALRALHEPPVDDTDLAAALIARRDALPPLRISCGADDALLPDVRALRDALTSAAILHQYAETPGGHSWGVWNEDLRATLLFIAAATARRRRADS